MWSCGSSVLSSTFVWVRLLYIELPYVGVQFSGCFESDMGGECFAGEPSEKSLEVMRKFSEQYARKSDTFFCVDKGVTAVVVKVCFTFF